ncbi:hypothetical protein MT418_000424 [Batrachochytrium dendrobatidis]
MPVQRKQNQKANRANPILGAGVFTDGSAPKSNDALSISSQLQNIPALQKLKSEDASDRAWAATAVSHFVQDDAQRKQLLSSGLLPLLVPLLADTHSRVVLEVLGAMQNVVISGGESAALDLIHMGVMTPLMECLSKIAGLVDAAMISKSIPPKTNLDMHVDVIDESDGKKSEDLLQPSPFDLAQQAFGLLWSLGEVSNDVVVQLSNVDVITFAMRLLDPLHISIVPWPLMRVIGQFLNTIIESNPKVHAIFSNTPAFVTLLFSFVNSNAPDFGTWNDNKIVLAVLCASILENLRPVLIDQSDTPRITEFYSHILTVLSKSLDLDLQSQLVCVASAGAALASQKETLDNEMTDSHDSLSAVQNKDTKYLAELESKLENMQLALELLANIYSEEAPEAEQCSEEVEQDDMTETDIDMDDMAIVTCEDTEHQENATEANLPTSVLSQALLSDTLQLLPKLARIATVQLPVPSLASKSTESVMIHIHSVLARTLGCITNMILLGYLSEWQVSQATLLTELFQGIFKSCINISSAVPTDMVLLDACIGAQWSLLSPQVRNALIITPTQDYVDWLLKLVAATSGAPASLRAKGVGILAHHARLQGNIEVNRIIGRSFIAQLATSDAPEVLCEILNGIYDIYGDATFDYDMPVFVQGGFLAQLEKLHPTLRSKFKSIDKRKQRDVRERADEMILNLRAFIQYKASERK